MSRLLVKIDRRTKRTERSVLELRAAQTKGIGPSLPIETLKKNIPVMPFNDWEEVIKFEKLLETDDGLSAKKNLVIGSYFI